MKKAAAGSAASSKILRRAGDVIRTENPWGDLTTSNVDEPVAILLEALSLVAVTNWTFARIDARGVLVSPHGSRSEDQDLAKLAVEYKLQCAKVAIGSRIAATLGPLEPDENCIILIFGDARTRSAVLLLSRDGTLGPFTSSDISVLAFMLAAVSDRLEALRLQPREKAEDAFRMAHRIVESEQDQAFFLLDADLRIVLEWHSVDKASLASDAGLNVRVAERLPPLLESTVRALSTSWAEHATPPVVTSLQFKFLLLRVQPLSGPIGRFIGVRIQRFVRRNSLTGAALRFRISPRETQVLALLLDGEHLDKIALKLNITSSTVQNHIKNLLEKTGSLSRSELLARVLGWESISRAKALEDVKET